jgi:hypothetical protein
MSIVIDDSNDVYITGYTFTDALCQTTPGAYDTNHEGDDVFVVKLSPDGNGPNDLLYGTYLGGSSEDSGWSIDVFDCNIYVTGYTASSDFNVAGGPIDPCHNGGDDVFVAKINPANNGPNDLVYSTFLGGDANDYGCGITVDSSASIYITGTTEDGNIDDFPTTSGAYDQTHNGHFDVFVSKLEPNEGDPNVMYDLSYSTFIGGTTAGYAGEVGYSIKVLNGRAFVTGWTDSNDFPTEGLPYDDTYNGGNYDAFVCILAEDGNDLRYSTFIGGEDGDVGFDIVVDSNADVYVVGNTNSDESEYFPVTSGAYDVTYNGGGDLFVFKMNIDCFPHYYNAYDDWVAMGKPDCWCAPPYGSGYQCDGDADGVNSGFPYYYRVYNGDLNLIVDNWMRKIDDPNLNPCADVNHDDSGPPFYYRVYNADLQIIIDHWMYKDPNLPGDCPRDE